MTCTATSDGLAGQDVSPLEDLDHHVCRIVQGWISGTGDSGAEAAPVAARIVGLYGGKTLEDLECFCWTLWSAFVKTAESAPEDAPCVYIDRLVRLMRAIKESEPLRDCHGHVLSFWAGECWKDLPLLGPAMREQWNTSPSKPSQLPAHLNKNIFAARLTDLRVADFSLYGLWALREALEGDTPWSPAGPPEYTIPVAHAWVMHAGEALVHLDDDRGQVGKGGSLWKGQSGFCKERWIFWEQGLRHLSDAGHVSREIRQLAQEAAARMKILSHSID